MADVERPGDAPVVTAVSTDGGADGGTGGWRGVVAHFRGCGGTLNAKPRAYHSGDHTEIAAMLGRTTVETSLAFTWLSVVAFRVPPAGSPDPVEVLGAEHTLTSVTGE